MGKLISVPPILNTADIPKGGAEVTIKAVREVHDQFTTIGTMIYGIALTVEYEGEDYSQLFGLDKDVIAGSVGRLLVSIGIEDTKDKDFKEKVQALAGKKVFVRKREGKIYWYP